jgi:indole-3-glycerol phosphate synthase
VGTFRLDHVCEAKRGELAAWGKVADLEAAALAARPPRDFAGALKRSSISVIAEIKPRCPLRGEFWVARDPTRLADLYQSAGARAMSVLADGLFFGGSAELVDLVANHPGLTLPVLYKDFVLDPRQVYKARSCGADALLLIVRIVEPDLLRRLISLTHDLGMEALVETFDESEISLALAAGAKVIGINNRDPETQQPDLQRSAELVRKIPEHVLRISESAIRSPADVLFLSEAGFDSMLVGEALLSARDPADHLVELLRAAH